MGFLGIDRDIENHWIYQDAEYFKVWFEILLRARFANDPGTIIYEGQMIQVEYGEFIFGRKKWSDRIGIGQQRLRTLMKKLVDEKMLELKTSSNKFSKYFVVNYEKYNKINHQTNQQEAASGVEFQSQPTNTITISQPPANHQLTTKEQSNNISSSAAVYESSPHSEIEQHFVRRRNKGLNVNSEDTLAIDEVIKYGIPVEFIKATIDKAFTDYKPKYPRDQITNFTYVLPRIYQDWHKKQEIEKGGQAHEKPRGVVEGVRPGSNTPPSRAKDAGESIVYRGKWDHIQVSQVQ